MTSSLSASQPASSHRIRPGSGLTWLAFTWPSQLWPQLETQARPWLAAALVQVLLLLAASILAAPAYGDLDRVLSGVNPNPLSFTRVLGLALSVALAVALSNLAAAAILWPLFQLVGLRAGYWRILVFVSVVLLPLVLGQALGKVVFAIAMPLTTEPAEVIAWHLRPFTAGLNTLLPRPPHVLSLPWAMFCTFDLFGLWSLWLAISGLKPWLQAQRLQVPWLIVMLVLVFAAGALVLWQAGQGWLAALN